MDQFLVHILKIAPSFLKGRVLKPADYNLFQVYHDTDGHETNLYNPFITLANHFLDKVPNILDVVCCRDDKVIVKGSAGQRKPDVVLVGKEALAIGDRISVDNLSKEGPKYDPFYWFELRAFCEFKTADVVVHHPLGMAIFWCILVTGLTSVI